MQQNQITPPLTVAMARRDYARAEPGYISEAYFRLRDAVKQELKKAAAEVKKQNG